MFPATLLAHPPKINAKRRIALLTGYCDIGAMTLALLGFSHQSWQSVTGIFVVAATLLAAATRNGAGSVFAALISIIVLVPDLQWGKAITRWARSVGSGWEVFLVIVAVVVVICVTIAALAVNELVVGLLNVAAFIAWMTHDYPRSQHHHLPAIIADLYPALGFPITAQGGLFALMIAVQAAVLLARKADITDNGWGTTVSVLGLLASVLPQFLVDGVPGVIRLATTAGILFVAGLFVVPGNAGLRRRAIALLIACSIIAITITTGAMALIPTR